MTRLIDLATIRLMLDEIVQTIPAQPGSYALWLHLPQTRNLTIGKLGRFTFRAGDYFYLGSAFGPGGLRARLGRHLCGDGKSHWHVDYLRQVTEVIGFGYMINCRGEVGFAPTSIPIECAWSQKLAALPGSRTPIPGFGSSDCTLGCAAHLVYLPSTDPGQISTLLNCEVRSLPDA